MRRFETTHPVRHSPREMFDLVINVGNYPEFLPLCETLIVLSDERSGVRQVTVADMVVGYKKISERFRSRVEAHHDTLDVVVRYIDGPISHLENRWSFSGAAAGGCEIGFFLEYEFRNMALQMLMGSVFDRAFAKFATAFEERANVVYGRRVDAGFQT